MLRLTPPLDPIFSRLVDKGLGRTEADAEISPSTAWWLGAFSLISTWVVPAARAFFTSLRMGHAEPEQTFGLTDYHSLALPEVPKLVCRKSISNRRQGGGEPVQLAA